MRETTTIKVQTKTRDALAKLKGDLSYDELLEMLLRTVPEGDEEGKFTAEFRLELLEQRLNPGPYYTMEQVKAELGMA
jgi:hypothetical protein